MDFLIASAYAQAAGQPAGPNPLFQMLFFVGLLGVMFVFMIRPQMKRAKEHRALVAQLAKGDEVLTNGGVAGRIDEIGDHFVTLEIAPNVKVKLQKQAVSMVLPKGSLKSA